MNKRVGQGVCFLVDFYFLSSVVLFCFPCMVGTSTGTACDGSWGQRERKGNQRIQGWGRTSGTGVISVH